MTSVITGDIIKSRVVDPTIWIGILKKALSHLSPGDKNWEIYRGDSFQIEIPDICTSFLSAVYIKASVKTMKGLDVRLAIGIGEKDFKGNSVMESNGEAFIFSGETLEFLKKERQNLQIKTKHPFLNGELNLYFKLALIAMDNWTSNSAEAIKIALENDGKLQSELAQIIGISQDAVSKRLKRGYFNEIMALHKMFHQKITLQELSS